MSVNITTIVLIWYGTTIKVLHRKTVWDINLRQLVETFRYKPEGRGFDSRWDHWNFSLTQSFRPHYGTEVDSTYNRNEYQAYVLGVKAAGV
jgi:hypothetical protein